MAVLVERLQQALEGRYRVERELGRGGMATVFLAEDSRHRRRVAIKVLDAEVAGAIGPERFTREIDTVANLTHPHILPLHDSGEASGLLYYVMPYVEGESLRARLAREGALPVDEVVRLGREIADALHHAHARGIVHRDIKPENVLMVAGHAMVADFGIARTVGAVGAQRLTTMGVTVGTPAYMSPEQAAGSQVLDGRSDQYSLACTLYELLAGQPPFTGPGPASLIHQHLNVAPRAVTDLRPAVPERVREALARALAKLPADRYASMAEFALALGAEVLTPAMGTPAAAVSETATTSAMPAARVPTPTPARPRGARAAVAVVALATLAMAAVFAWQRWGRAPAAGPVTKDWILVAAFEGPPDDSSLAVASRELISAAIDQSRAIGSLPRERILRALAAAGKPRGTRVDAAVARELAFRSGVRTVLEGQVGRLGSGYSIVLRLVNADSANVILTETGTAKNADALIPALGNLAKQLREDLGENRSALAATRSMSFVATPSLEAYKLFLSAMALGRTGDNLRTLATYRAALALDPEFAQASANMAFPYYNLGYMDSVVLVCDQALRHPERLDDRTRTRLLAVRLNADGDWEGARRMYEQALLENPEDLWALSGTSADFMWKLGRYEEALDRNRRLQRLRPFGPSDVDRLNESGSLLYLGRFDEARRVAEQVHGVWETTIRTEIACASGDYATAESLIDLSRRDPRQQVENVGGADLAMAKLCRVRGRIAELDSAQARYWRAAESPDYGWGDKVQVYRGQMVFQVQCLGRKPPLPPATWPETTAAALTTRGLRAAFLGDSRTAARCLRQAQARPRRERMPEGPSLLLLEAAVDGVEGRWDDAVATLQPVAVQRYLVGPPGGDEMSWIRWLLSDAYERLGRPDSAAVNLERITGDPLATTYRPYASLRLVPLYGKLSRGQEVRRHLALAARAFAKPDPPIAMRMRDARAVVAGLQ
jgi:tetratricopeptide (TPR) repeat protein